MANSNSNVTETLTLSEQALSFQAGSVRNAVTTTETVAVALRSGIRARVSESLTLTDTATALGFVVRPVGGTTLDVSFPFEVSLEGVTDPNTYELVPLDGGIPLTTKGLTPIFHVFGVGTNGKVLDTGNLSGVSDLVYTPGQTYDLSSVGSYLDLSGSSLNQGLNYRIESVPTFGSGHPYLPYQGQIVQVSQALLLSDPVNGASGSMIGSLGWKHKGGVQGVQILTSEATGGKTYLFRARGLRPKQGQPLTLTQTFVAVGVKPTVTGVSFLPDGSVKVTYNEAMRQDLALTSPEEYSITGPTTVRVKSVRVVSPTQVLLTTDGFGPGTYTLSVNVSGTPKDVAGNPLDPTYHQASFSANSPLNLRSIFTDHGPITKPALTLASGTGLQILTYVSPIFGTTQRFTSETVQLTGGSFTSNVIGLEVRLAGTSANDGTYRVVGLGAAAPTNKLKLQASLHLPDTTLTSASWVLLDARNGQIADDPSDVVVTVNGVSVTPIAVAGLLGQIVLPTVPDLNSDVKVKYSWIKNPTVEIRELNSRSFVLNDWVHDQGRANPTQHAYRYRSTLATPSTFVPDASIPAKLPAPLSRNTHYRAYERKYSALLNDPQLLLLNTPLHRIAYAPLEVPTVPETISYMADTLPEVDPTSPWDRMGTGSASIVSGTLLVGDTTTGSFPGGDPLLWSRPLDLAFPHLFAATWRMNITSVQAREGIFTGVSVGWSDDNSRAVVVGYLDDGVTKRIGFLKQGFGNDPSSLLAWGGGLDNVGNPTGDPVESNWTVLRSYRLSKDKNGVIKLFLDGSVIATLQILESELPFLSELNTPFNDAARFFFGSISRPAQSTSSWDFVRYLVQPTNPELTQPSVFVTYAPSTVPEAALIPWIPVGYHGTETLLGGQLLLDSTSSTTLASEAHAGLIDGDFRGFTRTELLLSAASDVVLDAEVQLRSATHGISPNGLMVAVDDGNRLLQLCFFPATSSPKVSYPGRSLPEDSDYPWERFDLGTPAAPTAEMIGQTLRITDTSLTDGLVYATQDTASAENRIFGSLQDYTVEFRAKVLKYTVSPQTFAGVTVDAFDGFRDVGLQFVIDPVYGPSLVLQSNGLVLSGGSFSYAWNDVKPHTYRLVKSTSPGTLVADGFHGTLAGTSLIDTTVNFTTLGVVVGDHVFIRSGSTAGVYPITAVSTTTLTVAQAPVSGTGLIYEIRRTTQQVVSLFADSTLVGLMPYESFALSGAGFPTLSFGSSTPNDVQAVSTVDWVYCNAWRNLDASTRKYVGLWKGTDPTSLTGYYLPEKVSNVADAIDANHIQDLSKDFVALGVQLGDRFVIDFGPNKGDYEITQVLTHSLEVLPALALSPTQLAYRIPLQVDFTQSHQYRMVRAPGGSVTIFLDGAAQPMIRVAYSESTLPASALGVSSIIQNKLPSVTWGAFDPENISQSMWGYLRYGITRSSSPSRIVPQHQVLNQRNVISSPEHLTGTVAHGHTQFSSSSTGIPFPWESYVNNPLTKAFTVLNEGTPLVPSTQTYEVRKPTPTFEAISGLNLPENVLNQDGSFLLNDGTTKVTLLVPDDVLYNSLQVIEQTTGELDLLSIFSDESGFSAIDKLSYQKEVCLQYDGTLLPENDHSGTPWALESGNPSQVTTTNASGVLTYATTGATQTIYRNMTPLPDSNSLSTQVAFRLCLRQDGSAGLGDSGARFGFSAFGLTAALAFVTTSLGDREVRLLDLNANQVLGAIPFDFLDGGFHTYRLVKDPSAGTLEFTVEP